MKGNEPMKKETRNLIVENIGLAWVYANPKCRQYLNEALQGFAQHEREQDEAIDRLAAFVMEEADQPASQPREGSKKGAILASLKKRVYGVTRHTLLRESGATALSLHKHLQDLRADGYDIVCKRQGKKTPVYKLVG
jgi:hypothetical protein